VSLVEEIRHPLLVHKLNRIRDVNTKGSEIKKLLEEIAIFMVFHALGSLPFKKKKVETWIGPREFEFVDESSVAFVPVLRAGQTLRSKVYYSKLPDLEGRKVLILDPMLATGGTLVRALEEVLRGRPAETMSLHVVCAPEGIERVRKSFPKHKIFTVSVDEGLNDRGFIIPGLGDMGDRLFP